MKTASHLKALLDSMISVDAGTTEIDGKIYAVRILNPTQGFWDSYRANKATFKAAGIHARKDEQGAWIVEHRRLLNRPLAEQDPLLERDDVNPDHNAVTPKNDPELENVADDNTHPPNNGNKNTRSDSNLPDLLLLIHQFFCRFMVFRDPDQPVACTLWVVHTWVLDAFTYSPYLYIYSPLKRCGKTRLLDCLRVLVRRPWSIVAGTEATIIRKIDSECPTLLFDEIDTIYKSGRDRSRENLRAVLNAGFVRGAVVPRCLGAGVTDFGIFSAKAFAGIGDCLPMTVKDRSIRIALNRRAREQQVDSLRHPDFFNISQEIAAELSSFGSDEEVIQRLAESRPEIPVNLGDRAADISEPLLAIAELAGGKWPAMARNSLMALLHANEEEEADDVSTGFLYAIRDVFREERKHQLPTIVILRRLAAREEAAEWTTRWAREIGNSNARGPAASPDISPSEQKNSEVHDLSRYD